MKLLIQYMLLTAFLSPAYGQVRQAPIDLPAPPPAKVGVTSASPDAEHDAIALKLATKEITDPKELGQVDWNKVKPETRSAVRATLAEKTTFTRADVKVIADMPYAPCAALEAKQSEILNVLDKSDPKRYKIKYEKLSAPPEGGYGRQMKGSEVLAVMVNLQNEWTYNTMRTRMLSQCIQYMVKKRKADGLAPFTDAEFETEVAPIVAALNAPLWAGLIDYMKTRGGDHLVESNYAPLVASLTKSCADYPAGSPALFRMAGSLQFWKGVAGYNAWLATK